MHAEATYPQSLTPRPREIQEALGDWLLARSSFDRADLDPIATVLLRDDADLIDVACALNRVDIGTTHGPLAIRQLVTGDFPAAFLDAQTKPLLIGYHEGIDDYEAVLADVPTKNFRPITLPVIDLGELTPEAPLPGLPELPIYATDEQATDAIQGLRPYQWRMTIFFSRELLVNDEVQLVTQTVRAMGRASAHVEVALIAEVLESTENLTDGSALFTAANAITASLDVSGLNSAFNLLRTQTTPRGRRSNFPGTVLLVPPDEVATAHVLNQAMGNPLQIVCNAHLASGKRYLFAPPSMARSLVRVRLERSTPGPKIFRWKQNDHDGLGLTVIHESGIFAASRLGVCRMSDS